MLKLGAIRTRKLRIFCWTENKIDTHQKMVKPIEPPAVLKPHISDIGMQPQVFVIVNVCVNMNMIFVVKIIIIIVNKIGCSSSSLHIHHG